MPRKSRKTSHLRTTIFVLLILFTTSLLRYGATTDNSLRGVAVETPEGTIVVNSSTPEGRYHVWHSEHHLLAVQEHQGTGSFRVPTGSYLVQCLDVPGFLTPESAVVEVREAEITVAHCNYASINTAPLLNLKLYPEAAHYEVFNAEGEAVASGQGSAVMNLPRGKYSIRFYSIPGYQAPPVEPFLMIDRITTTISADYLAVDQS